MSLKMNRSVNIPDFQTLEAFRRCFFLFMHVDIYIARMRTHARVCLFICIYAISTPAHTLVHIYIYLHSIIYLHTYINKNICGISSASCFFWGKSFYFIKSIDVRSTLSLQSINKYSTNESHCKTPATISKKSVSPSGERPITIMIL